MDENQATYAAFIINSVSTFGIVTNGVALLTIYRKKALHNSFGIICATVALTNFFILSLNTIWYSMPDYPMFGSDSRLNRQVGYIGSSLWIFSCRAHFLISLNRFVAAVFPIYSYRFQTEFRTICILAALLILAAIQNFPALVMDDFYFAYDRAAMYWSFAQTERGKILTLWLNTWSCEFDYCTTFLLDLGALLRLRLYRYQKSTQLSSDATRSSLRSTEGFLAFQAFAQCFPDIACFVSFHYITPRTTTTFDTFLSTTVAWHLAFGFDGLIIDIFHTRPGLFRRKKTQIAPSHTVSMIVK